MAQRLAATVGASERPSQCAFGLDARPLGECSAGSRDRVAKAEAVIDVEEGELEVRGDAVRREEAVDGRDEPVLLGRLSLATAETVEVAEEAGVLGERRLLHGLPLEARRRAKSPAGRLDPGERVKRGHVARPEPERCPVLHRGGPERALGEIELAEL